MLLDTNVCLGYSLHFKRKAGAPEGTIKAPYSDSIRGYLGARLKTGAQLIIPVVVIGEFDRKLWDVLAQTIQKSGLKAINALPLYRAAQVSFKDLVAKGKQEKPRKESVNEAKEFYSRLWADPALAHKREAWARLKRKGVGDGPPTGADIEILAVAIEAARGDSELMTLDNDFLVFKDEILSQLGIVVRDCSML